MPLTAVLLYMIQLTLRLISSVLMKSVWGTDKMKLQIHCLHLYINARCGVNTYHWKVAILLSLIFEFCQYALFQNIEVIQNQFYQLIENQFMISHLPFHYLSVLLNEYIYISRGERLLYSKLSPIEGVFLQVFIYSDFRKQNMKSQLGLNQYCLHPMVT